MKGVLLLSSLALISSVAHADLTGAETGTGTSEADACATAKRNAGKMAEINRSSEAAMRKGTLQIKVVGCTCSAPKNSEKTPNWLASQIWTCEASWGITFKEE